MKTGTLHIILGAGAICISGALALQEFQRQTLAPHALTESYLACRMATNAIYQYSLAHDNKLPPAVDWEEDSQPYSGFRKEEFQEQLHSLSDDRGSHKYVMNTAASKLDWTSMIRPDQVVVFFPVRNVGGGESAPLADLRVKTNASFWLSFADGHVEYLFGGNMPFITTLSNENTRKAYDSAGKRKETGS